MRIHGPAVPGDHDGPVGSVHDSFGLVIRAPGPDVERIDLFPEPLPVGFGDIDGDGFFLLVVLAITAIDQLAVLDRDAGRPSYGTADEQLQLFRAPGHEAIVIGPRPT